MSSKGRKRILKRKSAAPSHSKSTKKKREKADKKTKGNIDDEFTDSLQDEPFAVPAGPALLSIPIINTMGGAESGDKGNVQLKPVKETHDSILPQRPLTSNIAPSSPRVEDVKVEPGIGAATGASILSASSSPMKHVGPASSSSQKVAPPPIENKKVKRALVQVNVMRTEMAKNQKTIDSATARVIRNQKTVDTARQKRRVLRTNLINALQTLLDHKGAALNDESVEYIAEMARWKKEEELDDGF